MVTQVTSPRGVQGAAGAAKIAMAQPNRSADLDPTWTTATPLPDYRDTAASCRISLLPEWYIGRNSQRQAPKMASFSFPEYPRLI